MKRRCVFLDRDGVINAAPPEGEYISAWSEFRLIPAIVDWIRLFNALGLLVIVVTNQRGVARGFVAAADLEEIHRKMCEELLKLGARIDDVLCCPHEEGACDCRKPRPGLVLEAARRWDIDVAASVLIGDSELDRRLAKNCNMRFVRVQDGRVMEVS